MKVITTLALISCVFTGCAQMTTSNYIKQKKYQGFIFSKDYTSRLVQLEEIKERFTPSEKDVITVETILTAQIRGINKSRLNQTGNCPIIDETLPEYKRQYLGYINKNGDKVIWINFIGGKAREYSDQLSKDIIIIFDGCSHYWNVKVNITKGHLYDLHINGSS